MLRAFTLSFAQLGDPPFVRVLVKSLILTAMLFIVAAAALVVIVRTGSTALGVPDWGANLLAAATLVGGIFAAWLLFRAAAIAVIGIFADEVVRAVEARHYPAALANAREVALGRSLAMGAGSAARTILVNVLLSPLYLLLLVTGVGTAAVFLIVNAWLLGRDLGDMVAARHLPRAAMRAWRATSRRARFLLGLAVAALFVIPVVNLFAPILGAAMATHRFHGGKAR